VVTWTAATTCRDSRARRRRRPTSRGRGARRSRARRRARPREGGPAVLERLESRYLLVTRGSRGMALFEREGR
jgi:hypothetical protein